MVNIQFFTFSYLSCGTDRVSTHAFVSSPGRFFASVEMKALLAYMVVTYDLKLEEGKQVPRRFNISMTNILGNADVLFRKRQK